MTVPAVLAASVALGPSVIIGGPMVSAQVLQNSLENLRSMKAEAAKMGKVDGKSTKRFLLHPRRSLTLITRPAEAKGARRVGPHRSQAR